jgi:lipopolysaccharide/colanic/teichoic acid biosynthesis glycosyltransferase
MFAVAKRALDLILAAIGLLCCSPLLVIGALAIWIEDGFPLLFRHVRPGYHDLPFTVYKFRTMNDARDAAGDLLPDAARLTRVGRILRQWSIDELPQLWNVLCGQMSLVGPRPLLMEYLERYTPEQARRHDVKPGITGWAQANGRNALTWEEKFTLDVWYVDHQSFRLDLKILWLSLLTIFGRKGISQPGAATAEKFMGSNRESHPSARPGV